jgi:hypothetical protein
MLGMDELSLETFDTWKLRKIALVVIIVASGAYQESAGELALVSAVLVDGRNRPALFGADPFASRDPQPELDLVVDAVLARRVGQVALDRGTIGKDSRSGPGPEVEAVSQHVGI